MKSIALISVALLVAGCGTVVGNGRTDSRPERSSYEQPDSAKDNANPVSAGGNESPPNQPESATQTLATYFLVPCASPFASAKSGSFLSSSGSITIQESGDSLVLSGDITATVRPAATSGSPYAIEVSIGTALNLTCETSVETPINDDSTKVVITFSDDAQIEWTYDASNLLNIKVISADGSQQIEYLLNGQD